MPVGSIKIGQEKIPSPQVRFGFTGHILRHKGVHILIDAFKQLDAASKATLVIYGDPDKDLAYAQQLRILGAGCHEIIFKGGFRNEQIGAILQTIDVVVVPSLWYENAPVTIAEAFAAKIPVIASNLGGMAEAVQDGVSGLLFEPGNPSDLARQMRLLIDDPRLLRQMRLQIPQVRSVQDEAKELESIYHYAARSKK